MNKRVFAFILVAAAPFLGACEGDDDDVTVFRAQLRQINAQESFTVPGATVEFLVEADGLMEVRLQGLGLDAVSHPTFLDAGDTCPTMAADVNQDGIVDAVEGQSAYGQSLLALDGKEASFLAGGEFPFPVVQGGASDAVTIVFKEFGIRLNFTPTVTNSGNIHLKVAPEVSALDFGSGLVVSGFQIPTILSRRAETEIELRDGQTFAIAGLIDNSIADNVDKIPILGDLPILGPLFRSSELRQNRSELPWRAAMGPRATACASTAAPGRSSAKPSGVARTAPPASAKRRA